MVAVVAAMGGEVEGDREALLAGGEIAPVEGVGILGGGEAGVLPDRPRLGDVHGRVGAAQIRRDAGEAVEAGQAGDIVRAVGRLDGDAFGREPGLVAVRRGRQRHLGEIDRGEIGDAAHGRAFRLIRTISCVATGVARRRTRKIRRAGGDPANAFRVPRSWFRWPVLRTASPTFATPWAWPISCRSNRRSSTTGQEGGAADCEQAHTADLRIAHHESDDCNDGEDAACDHKEPLGDPRPFLHQRVARAEDFQLVLDSRSIFVVAHAARISWAPAGL